jgi:hypothetical protein
VWLAVRSVHRVEDVQDLLGASPDANIPGEIYPADISSCIDQKLGGARDIGALNARMRMHEVPAANDFVFGVRENRESIASRLAEMLGHLRSVDANGDDTNLARVEIGKALFETPQLGVAEGSPIAAVEDQDDGSGFGGGSACGRLDAGGKGGLQQIRKRDGVAGRIGESEVWSKLANLRRAVGRGNVFRQNEDSVEKESNKKNAENSQDAAEDFSAVRVGAAKGAEDSGD